MKLKAFQVYDTVAMTVQGIIMMAIRPEPVIRSFIEMLANPETQTGKYPDDFILLELGEQNVTTGELIPLPDGPKTIYTGKVWKQVRDAEIAAARASAETPADPGDPVTTFADWAARQRDTSRGVQ